MSGCSLSLNFFVLHATPTPQRTRPGGTLANVAASLCATGASSTTSHTEAHIYKYATGGKAALASECNKPAAASAAATRIDAGAAVGEAPSSILTASKCKSNEVYTAFALQCRCAPEACSAATATPPTTHTEETVGPRGASLVCMRLHSSNVVPPALLFNTNRAEALREIWGEARSAPPSACTPVCALDGASPNMEEGRQGWHSVSKKRVYGLLQELLDIGFTSVAHQRLLREATLSRWSRLLPTVTARYCQRSFALDVGNNPGADFVLYRHQNGLVLVGLAPSHIILQEARRRCQLVGEEKNDLLAHSSRPHADAVAQGNANPLLDDDNGSISANPLMQPERPSSIVCSRFMGPDSVPVSACGSVLKVSFRPEAMESPASGKRKRGGIQLHVRMRLGTIALQQVCPLKAGSLHPDECLTSCCASLAKEGIEDGRTDTVFEAPIFGCIKGELLEVNETLDTHANALLEPPEQGGWLFIAKPAKRQDWGIFVNQQEAQNARPRLFSPHE